MKKHLFYVCLLFLGLIALLIPHQNEAGKSNASQYYNFDNAETDADRVAFIAQFGWQVSNTPIETEHVKIPESFDQVHEDYNLLQKRVGLDLEPYKGKVLVRYSYQLYNHPSNNKNARVNVFVYAGSIVAADVMSTDLDGFMHAICDKE